MKVSPGPPADRMLLGSVTLDRLWPAFSSGTVWTEAEPGPRLWGSTPGAQHCGFQGAARQQEALGSLSGVLQEMLS